MFEIEQQDQLSFRGANRGWPVLRVLRTEFTWHERKIAHYNVHLATFGPTKPWIEGTGWLDVGTWLTHTMEVRRAYRIRAWEVREIRELIENERYPVILSGDFNGTPDSWVYHRLSQGLQDVYRTNWDRVRGGGPPPALLEQLVVRILTERPPRRPAGRAL